MSAGKEFEQHRARLFGLAYRLLGSAQEAEDAVQDAYLRWHNAERRDIHKPVAWLVKVVTNLCLTRLESARTRRERYVGPWLPEPVLTEAGPAELVEHREAVSFGLLVLLERLRPAERAVFVLREAFGYSHRELAGLLDRSEASCRQLHHRATQRLADAPASAPVPDQTARTLIERFLAAARCGDVATLERLLAADVTSIADGGGQVPVEGRPVTGQVAVARYLAGAIGKFGADIDARFAEVNGQQAVLGLVVESLAAVFAPEIADGRLTALHIVANPEKLRYVRRQLSQREALFGS